MSGPAAILREVHRLRRFARDLHKEIDRVPQSLQVQRAKVSKQEEKLRETQETIKHLKVALHEKEVTLASKNQQIKKHEKQLNEAGGKKEYDALLHEITEERKGCHELEDDILNDMALLEERTSQIPQLEQMVHRFRDETAQLEKTGQDRLVQLHYQLADVRRKIRETEAGLPEDIHADYSRLINAMGEDAMSSVHNRTCTACYTEITQQAYNDLLRSRFVVCKNCGRILYLIDEQGLPANPG